MNKREYLRSKGFQIGERGRMSQAMKNVLLEAEENGTVFDDVVSVRDKRDDVWAFMPEEIKPHIPVQEALRDARELVGYTREGNRVSFVLCGQCSYHMIYCSCEGGVVAPDVIATSKDPLVRIRQIAHIT